MRVLVTGATGFVGACLARKLLVQGHEVHVFIRKQSNCWRIQDVINDLITHEVDLTDRERVGKSVKEIRAQRIYHLATYGGFAHQREEQAIIAANFMGTVNLLQACEQVGFDGFINTGSSSEYGMKKAAMKETDCLEPIGAYGVSKSAATLFCRSEAVQKQLPIATVRLFSPYGSWDDPQRLIPYLIASLLRNERPGLSTPHAVRDYVFIEDVLRFYQLLSERIDASGAIYNVGSGIQHSIDEIAAITAKIIGSDLQPQWGAIERKRPESAVWVADIAKARSLGWEPQVGMEDGLCRTIAWQREHLSRY